jgi:bacterioferritin (cytochrome b1)
MSVETLTMLGPDEILEGLYSAIVAEMQAVADYERHAAAVADAGMSEALAALADVEREHALRLNRRLVALDGEPPSDEMEAQPLGGTAVEWLTHDLEGEQWAIVEYARLVAGIMDDDDTAELMAELLRDEIRHARWLKSALRALKVPRVAGG